MKKSIFLSCFTVLLISCTFSQELNLDEVLAKYYQETGMEKMHQLSTVIMTGSLTQQDYMPLKIIKMRPDKYRMEFDVADISALQVFDGINAWMTAPWTGNPKPQSMNPERSAEMRSKADFDGLLFDWKKKGHIAELVLNDTVSPCFYKIKLTRKDGGREYYFIDRKDFLLKKRIFFRKGKDKEIEIGNLFRDFRSIDGIVFNFVTETTMDGQSVSLTQFDTIELNKPVDEKIFVQPDN